MIASRAALALIAASAAAGAAHGQGSYPERPLRLIVPFPPGGSDTVARLLGQKLVERFGQQVIADNRPGAAGTLGATLAAQATPDGYTLLFATASFAITASLFRKLPYDALRDFAAVGFVAQGPMLVVVHPSVRAASVSELVSFARTKPGAINFASTGTGGITHLAAELFLRTASITMTHVPYKGTGPAQTDLLSGQVQVMFDVIGPAAPHVRSGRLRALAVTTATRSALLPELPTVAESGVPGYEAATWYGVLAPRAVPRTIVGLLDRAIAGALAAPDLRDRLGALGFEPTLRDARAFTGFLHADIARWAGVIKEAGIVLQ